MAGEPWLDYQAPAAPAAGAPASAAPWEDYAAGTASGDQHLLGYGVEGAAENAVGVPASTLSMVGNAHLGGSGGDDSIAGGAMPAAGSSPDLDNPNGSNGPPSWLDPGTWVQRVHDALVSHGAPAAAPSTPAQHAAYNAGGVVGRTADALLAPETIPAALAVNVAGEGARTAVEAGGGTPGEADAADFLGSLGGGGFAAASRLVKRHLVTAALDKKAPPTVEPTPTFEPPSDDEVLYPNGKPQVAAPAPAGAAPSPAPAGAAPSPAPAGGATPPAAPAPVDPATVTANHWQRVGLDPQTKAVVDPQAYQQAVTDYNAHPESHGGKVLNTDIARDLSPEYNASMDARSTLSAAVHEPSSAFIKQLNKDKLAEPVPAGQKPIVVITAGGTGAGKTTAINAIPEVQQMVDQAHIVYDTNGNDLASATDKIDQALNAGHDVRYVHVARDSADALANGALSRAERQGRTVPIQEHINTHAGSADVTPQVMETYQNDPRFQGRIIDNTRGKGNAAQVAQMPQLAYHTPEELESIVKDQYGKGKISPRVYRGTLGEEPSAPGTEAQSGTPTPSSGEQSVGGPPDADNGAVPESGSQAVPGSEGQTPQGEIDRPSLLRRVLGPGTKVRTSALSGDAAEASTDFQQSKTDIEGGNPLRDVIAGERQGLHDYSDALIQRSGGTSGIDQLSRDTAGRGITAPLDDGYARMDLKTQRAYGAAKAKAAGQPIRLNALNDLLAKNKGEFMMADGGESLLKGVQQRMQDLGLSKEGSDLFNPATVEQAEALRKSVSGAWSPRTGHLVTAIKNALDEDVTKSAGEDVYKDARATRYARSVMFDNPKGVNRLLGEADGSPNRTVPFEKVQHEVTHLPIDQFAHLIGTYNKLTELFPEMAPSVANALKEIRGAFANGVKTAGTSTQGQWNQRAVEKYLAEHNGRMRMVFKPGDMAQFSDLKDAGKALHIDRSYPGAAAQGHNLLMRGALKGVEHLASTGGAHVGGVPGALVGHGLGIAAGKMGSSMARSAAMKRITTL